MHTTPNSINTNIISGIILNGYFQIICTGHLKSFNIIKDNNILHINSIKCLQVIFTIIRTDKDTGRAKLLIISIITKNIFSLNGDPEGL